MQLLSLHIAELRNYDVSANLMCCVAVTTLPYPYVIFTWLILRDELLLLGAVVYTDEVC